jgi:rhodanese-related sulfurtransferase
MAGANPPLVIDVRQPPERARKRLDGSVHIPLGRLSDQLTDLPRDRPVIVHCAGGYRSSIAASLLQRSGRTAVSEIAGGIGAWEQAGLPVAADQT